MSPEELEAIRARAQACDGKPEGPCWSPVRDRDVLLAEVDRLAVEVDRLRALLVDNQVNVTVSGEGFCITCAAPIRNGRCSRHGAGSKP